MTLAETHWLKRAEEIRTIADQCTDDGEKETLLKLASDYERLADRAQSREDAGQAQWPSPTDSKNKTG